MNDDKNGYRKTKLRQNKMVVAARPNFGAYANTVPVYDSRTVESTDSSLTQEMPCEAPLLPSHMLIFSFYFI